VYLRRVKLEWMRLVRATLDLIVILCCALALACGNGTPRAASADAADAGASMHMRHDAGAVAGAAADSGRPDTNASSDAGSPPAAAGAGQAGTGGRGAAGHATSQRGGAGGHPADAVTARDCGLCSAYAAPKQSGSVEPSELSALSGLAMSRSQPDILFAHNDHDRPVVYALDLQGKLHARITLEGAATSDIEDIAIGPCGATSCVYLADIGDNAASRMDYSVLRFVEPQVSFSPGSTAMTLDSTGYTQLHFTYDDGSHNAESLMVGPNGNVYIVTKLAPGSGGRVAATGRSDVYRIDASAFDTSATARARKLTSLPIPNSGEAALSAVAAHPCGLGFLARTYDRVYEFQSSSLSNFETAFASPPQIVAMPNEPQSEGIDYRSDGRGFVTSGEGSAAPIMLTSCAP
jgi:hypothetical protein